MRFPRLLPFGLTLLLLSVSSLAQQSTTTDAQAKTILQQSFAALSGSTSITDVTLSGTARRIAGSDDETGTAVLKALAAGASRVDLSLSSGQRVEVQNTLSAQPAGAWSGADGVSHPISYHNLMTDPSWFFPAFTIARLLSSQSYALSYLGQETRNGQTVLHVAASQQFPNLPPNPAAFRQYLTRMDLFLDASNYLPVALAFNTHPDNDARLDIPIEIRFSDYRAFGGAQVPFRIQKYLNNSLILDLQFQSATFNTGLTATDFQM